MSRAPTSAPHSSAACDIAANAASFRRHLRAANRAPATEHAYLDAVARLDAFLEARGMPRAVAAIRREHVDPPRSGSRASRSCWTPGSGSRSPSLCLTWPATVSCR